MPTSYHLPHQMNIKSCVCAYRFVNFPQIIWKVACGHGVTKIDLILADRQTDGTWFRFQPIYGDSLDKLPNFEERLCLPL